jgi:hypothetical protein
MKNSYKLVNPNSGWSTASVCYGTSTGTVTYPNTYTYPNATVSPTPWWGSSTVTLKEETPDEAFAKKKTITTKDGSKLELTFAEIYEFKRMGKVLEEMTKDEITDILLVLRI